MTTTLSSLLTPEQCKHVEEIIIEHAHDSLALVKELKQYFAVFANELEAKGVLGDYLAYQVAAHVQIAAEQMLERN